MIFGKPKDWEKEKKALYEKVKRFAVIDWTDLDKLLGTSVKKIYIYYKNYVVEERPFNNAEVKFLSKFMPVVDLTEGRPFPEEFEVMPRRISILGRLNLVDLRLPE